MNQAEEILKLNISGGSEWPFQFRTAPKDSDDLKSEIAGRLQPVGLEDARVEIACATVYPFEFRTTPGDAARLRAEIAGASSYDFQFRTDVGDAAHLKALLRAKKSLAFSFTTIFDPAKEKAGMERIELFRPNMTDFEIFAVPLNWIIKGTPRTWSLDLWFARKQHALPPDDIRIGVKPSSTSNAHGQEIAQNGYLSMKASSQTTWTPLTLTQPFSLLAAFGQNLWPNARYPLDFRLDIPVGAVSTGVVILPLELYFLRSVVHGESRYGEVAYRDWKVSKSQQIILRIHISG